MAIVDCCRSKKEYRDISVGDGFDNELQYPHGAVLGDFEGEWLDGCTGCGRVIWRSCGMLYDDCFER